MPVPRSSWRSFVLLVAAGGLPLTTHRFLPICLPPFPKIVGCTQIITFRSVGWWRLRKAHQAHLWLMNRSARNKAGLLLLSDICCYLSQCSCCTIWSFNPKVYSAYGKSVSFFWWWLPITVAAIAMSNCLGLKASNDYIGKTKHTATLSMAHSMVLGTDATFLWKVGLPRRCATCMNWFGRSFFRPFSVIGKFLLSPFCFKCAGFLLTGIAEIFLLDGIVVSVKLSTGSRC